MRRAYDLPSRGPRRPAPRRLPGHAAPAALGLASALALALLGGCGADTTTAPGSATRVTGASPFAPGCQGAPQSGTVYLGTEVEPSLAADPSRPGHLVAAWQQDRFSNGGASGVASAVSWDRGGTWALASAPFTRCTGGSARNGGDWERASDPWVAFGPDGTVHQAAVVFDDTGGRARRAVLASRSGDGGLTWSDPVALAADDDASVAVDKETLTPDPLDPLLVYAVWDRLAGLGGAGVVTGPAWFTRSTDGGRTWEPARVIHDPGPDAQTIGNQVVVLGDGTLVNAFALLTDVGAQTSPMSLAVIRSGDRGQTWSKATLVAQGLGVGIHEPATGRSVRSGLVVPTVVADRHRGTLHLAWADARFSGGARDGIAVASSSDGGLTWSAPRQANRDPAAAAFTPVLGVSEGGALALAYDELRPGGGPAATTARLATSSDGGATWEDVAVGDAFDLSIAPYAEGLFLGDYMGLAADGETFRALVVRTSGDASSRTDLWLGGR